MARVRRSIQELEQSYPAELDKVRRGFAALAAKPASDPDSFFSIAGCHGEQLRADKDGNKPAPETWWGGYCTHGNVLFPMWHRAYLLRLEDALRRVKGCEDVMVPFWDECLTPNNPVPKSLTEKTIDLDGKKVPNPLYSYRLAAPIVDDLSAQVKDKTKMDHRYSKPVGYETKRFPLSGLVGTAEYQKDSEIWNQKFPTDEIQAKELNANLSQWLTTDVIITDPDDPERRLPVDDRRIPRDRDLKSVHGRFKRCLETKSYTIFSNTGTERNIKANPNGLYVSLESPHNSIHLAVGGFYQRGRYIADRDKFYEDNRGANGDMGCNEMASFDPIFFFHHAFIDYVFWLWQRKHGKTAKGSLEIDLPDAAGTNTGPQSQPGLPPNTKLTMDTPLRPFKKPGHQGDESSDFYTSKDLVDVVGQLNYSYGRGSLDAELNKPLAVEPEVSLLGGSERDELHAYLEISNIDSSQYRGSFVVRAIATTPSGKHWEIGREAVLGRWNTAGCGNCLGREPVKAYVSVFDDLADALREDSDSYKGIEYAVDITTSDPALDFVGFDSERDNGPQIKNILDKSKDSS